MTMALRRDSSEVSPHAGHGDDPMSREPGQPTDANGASPPITSRRVFGRVATPPNLEATSEEFAFWVPEGTPVEKTQLVCATATFEDIGEVTFRGVVEEVSRRSRRQNVLEERDRYDGTPDTDLLLDSAGVTYARVRMLASSPPLLTPPREESPVRLATPDDARAAYGMDDMDDPLPVGLLKNGAERDAGPATIDLAYLLGQNGAHLNVTGISGAGTKSSALTVVLACLLHNVKHQRSAATDPLRIVPVVLNVKGTDLLFLDRRSRAFRRREAEETLVWARLGIEKPEPFAEAIVYAPQRVDGSTAVATGRTTKPYSWGLRDLLERDLFLYIFADDDREDENFLGLATAVSQVLASEKLEGVQIRPRMRQNAPVHTLDELILWVEKQIALPPGERAIRNQPPGTWSKLYRRLLRIAQSSSGVIRRYEESGAPLDITASETVPPRVVDIQSISDPGLQRFVVAAIVRQIADARTGPNAVQGLHYVLLIDELNRWAPRGGRDPITRLVEHVAAEMRSQGVVLFGAQQQASQVSEKVIENASIRLLGRTGALELEHAVWRGIPTAFRRMIGGLQPKEKVFLTPTARQPMFVRMPFPPWAMRRDEAEPPDQVQGSEPTLTEE